MTRLYAQLLFLALLLLAACHPHRRQQMLSLLDEADSLNRAYSDMPSDSLLRDATRYFDRHGSRDEQLRAHYLLGCAYRDQGQAPEALQAWHDAIDRADTTSTDSAMLQCLMAVYGQMADLYQRQNLPNEEIEAMREYGKYALLSKDTFRYIRNIELLVKPYDLLGDTSGMVNTLQKAGRLYEDNGLHECAVRTYPTLIYINIAKGRFSTADSLMAVFEKESGLFDENGEISSDRTTYYYFRGLSYIHHGNLDQAEHNMRMLLRAGKTVNGYRGLLEIYRRRGMIDSIARYSLLFEKALDSITNSRRTETVKQMSSLYKYQRFQRKAEYEAQMSMRLKYLLSFVCLSIVFIVSALYLVYLRIKKKRDDAQNKYFENRRLLERTKSEIELLRAHEKEYEDIIQEKKQQIQKLSQEVSSFRKKETRRFTLTERAFKNSDVYHNFHGLANAGRRPSEEDWSDLYNLFEQQLPAFHSFLVCNKHSLNETELKTCMLTRIHVSPSAIANMLNVSNAYISKIRRSMARELFNVSGGTKDYDREIQSIY